ncbi:hypothetical protein QEN19_002473 [Hanseniaspora menglaensis]
MIKNVFVCTGHLRDIDIEPLKSHSIQIVTVFNIYKKIADTFYLMTGATETILFSKRDDSCSSSSEYDGHLQLRILSIFIILISSSIGIYVPILSNRMNKNAQHPILSVVFFIARYFGQGVIFATAFIHLLQPANESLTADCLTGTWQEYPFAFAICMGAVFSIYLMEIVTRHYIEQLTGVDGGMHGHGHFGAGDIMEKSHLEQHGVQTHTCTNKAESSANNSRESESEEDIISKFDEIVDVEKNSLESTTLDEVDVEEDKTSESYISYRNQVVSVCILEFGVIFHSVFVGLTLGVVGKQFKTLFCVMVFHQMFEGAACGTRIVELGRKHFKTQLLFGLMFCITTPLTIAIGVGMRHSLSVSSIKANIVSGCFDSVSAGILIYNSFELLFSAFNEHRGNIKMKLLAYFTTCFGVGVMALLGKWA